MKTYKDNPILNMILNTDSYKLSHYRQYPPGTSNQFSYVEARGTDLEWEDPKVVFFGLQAFMKEYLTEKITHEHIDQAKPIVEAHGFDFNELDWRYIVNKYNGVLPLKIRAVREGTAVSLSNIMASVEVTDSRAFWLTSYIETAFLRAIWYPSTIASNGLRAKQIIKEYMDETADYDPGEIDFKLHDFGARGVSSLESAALGGMAHLVNFQGTDTISGVLAAKEYYGAEMAGFSIPASEHSTITSWGKEREGKAFANMLSQFAGPDKILACVSDSYDIYNATKILWGENLRQEIIDSGGTLVVRPDSGDPLIVPLQVIEILMEKFGYTVNYKGYRVLPDHVRVIQGDGITVDSMKQILENMKNQVDENGNGLSATNIAFGMGAGTLQKVDRDTFKFAMKCSAVEVNGVWTDVWKESPGKPSKRGRLTLVQNYVTKKFRTIEFTEVIDPDEQNMMDVVYMNGPLEHTYTSFANVRSEAYKAL